MLPEIRRSALISPCGTYRYRLERMWQEAGPVLAFVMLNPSTADGKVDDPTIRRCIHFAKAWGYGGLIVGNLFALRATDPAELYEHADPVGPDNDMHLAEIAQDSHQTVMAWGAHMIAVQRGVKVAAMSWRNPCALKITKDGHPGHPLYVSGATQPVPFPPEMDCV
jgi:hypothetical protein